MRSPADMDIVVIDITNRCHLNCSNCTRLIAHQTTTRAMDLQTFEKAVKSMRGWYRSGKVLGLIGGEPTLHKEFEEIAVKFKELWNPGVEHVTGLKPIADFNQHAEQRLYDRTSGRGLWTSLGQRFYEHYETIHDVFDHWNANTHEAGGKHQTALIDRKELCEKLGISDEEWIKYRDNCWVQNKWSAAITPKGAYFCEQAAQLDLLYNDGKRAWPIEPGWWQRQPKDFGDQLEICEMCALALPGPSQVDALERDIISPAHLERLQAVGSPAVKKGVYELYDAEKHTEQRLVTTKDSYVAGARVEANHESVLPRHVTGIMTAFGKEFYDLAATNHFGNAMEADSWIIVTDQGEGKHTVMKGLDVIRINPYKADAFNKGRYINAGLQLASKKADWILLTDADVILKKGTLDWIKSHALNPGCLYGTVRNGGGGVNSEPNGFFQLFNRRAKAIRDRWPKVMSEAFCSAGGIDSWFMQQFAPNKRIMIPELAVKAPQSKFLGEKWNGDRAEPCWRQVAMILPDKRLWMVASPPKGKKKLKLTESLHAHQVEVETDADGDIPMGIIKFDQQGIVFDGKPIGYHHIHVAAWF